MNTSLSRQRGPDAAALAIAPKRPAMAPNRLYWIAMLVASVFGTNLGDLWADDLFPDRLTSLASLLGLCAVAIWYDRRPNGRTEAGYWVTVVAMRAAATNLADVLTHDLALGYGKVAACLALLTMATAWLTHPNDQRRQAPSVDGAYWSTMFVAGLFGTVTGDLLAHTIGLYVASAWLCLGLAGLILLQETRAPATVLLYWAIVMAERCAGTTVGDSLASRHALGFGVKMACVCTGCLLLLSLGLRRRYRCRQVT